MATNMRQNFLSNFQSVFLFMLIWFCSYFLEKNMLTFFLKILDQKTNKEVKIQLIQTLSILVENIRNETSICKWKIWRPLFNRFSRLFIFEQPHKWIDSTQIWFFGWGITGILHFLFENFVSETECEHNSVLFWCCKPHINAPFFFLILIPFLLKN